MWGPEPKKVPWIANILFNFGSNVAENSGIVDHMIRLQAGKGVRRADDEADDGDDTERRDDPLHGFN